MEMDSITFFSFCWNVYVFVAWTIKYLSQRSNFKIYGNYRMIEGILIGLKTALSFQNLLMVSSNANIDRIQIIEDLIPRPQEVAIEL